MTQMQKRGPEAEKVQLEKRLDANSDLKDRELKNDDEPQSTEAEKTKREKEQEKETEEKLDEGLEESFPASDPPALTQPKRANK
ncbi:MAG: hypothetical protein Q8L99_06500 [Polycyclovorans sp.]|jgi:hypothetical protein|nr:hypothetical protein [Polycyclovorans sp.]